MAVKKEWYTIEAPDMFGNKVVGETPSLDSKNLVNRVLEVNLMEIENNYKRFFIKLKFKINEVEDKKVKTKFIGHDSMSERIYRMVQRNTRRVDVIQNVETKDGRKLRVKTIFILQRRVNTSIKASARKKVKEMIEKKAKEENFEKFIKDIIFGNVQEGMRKEISKIYPVGEIEIRKTEVIN